MKKKSPLSWIYTALVLMLLYLPIIVMIIFSFNSSRSTSVITGFSIKWYNALIHDNEIIKALVNTIVLALVSAVCSTVMGTAASVGIHYFSNNRIKKAVTNVTNFPLMNPDIVTGISMLLLFVIAGNFFSKNDVLGFGTVLITHITFCLPYVILCVSPKLRQMDKHLVEAALDLGCTPAKAFFKIVMPSIRSGILTGFLFAITLSVDDFVITYFVTGADFQTLPIKIYSMTKRFDPTVYALSTVMFVVIFALLLVRNIYQSRNDRKIEKKGDIEI